MAFNLDSIKKTTGLSRPPMICVHGTSGVGKTTMASEAPAPVFIQTELGEGLLELNTFGLASKYEDVIEAIDALRSSNHDWSTLVIDSVDHLEPLIWKHVCAENKWASIEAPGYGRGYIEAALVWRELMASLDELRKEKNMVIILIAHSEIKRFEDPINGSIDRYQMKLHKHSSAILVETADVVLFVKHKVTMRKEDKGFGVKVNKGIATNERIMCTTESPHFVAKNRYDLPPELPLGWADFEENVYKEKKA